MGVCTPARSGPTTRSAVGWMTVWGKRRIHLTYHSQLVETRLNAQHPLSRAGQHVRH
jgi:hypothetical protein